MRFLNILYYTLYVNIYLKKFIFDNIRNKKN